MIILLYTGINDAEYAKGCKLDKVSSKLTDYSSSPFINTNQTSTNNYSNIDDSKSHSSDTASNSNRKKNVTKITKNNNISEENENENDNENELNNNYINYDENFSMQNNNFSEYHDEEIINKEKNNKTNDDNNSNKETFNSIKNNMLIGTKGNRDQILVTGNNNINKNFMFDKNNNHIFLANHSQSSASLSERMKAKIQRTKELLEKKQYKASESLYMNEYYGKINGNKFQYNLESAHEFSELKSNNVCKISECPDCIDIINRINYLNNSSNYQNNHNNNNTNNSNLNTNNISNKKKLYSIQANNAITTKNNINKEKQNLSEKSCERSGLENLSSEQQKKEENSAALVRNCESRSKMNNNESFSSNGTSKNSCLDISLNETFSGICNRNNLSKREMKMLRNRISAQKSRDRKKQEMDDLKLITQELFNQNIKLKKQLEEKENKISEYKEMFNSLCENCKTKQKKLNSNNRANYLLEENKRFISHCLNNNNKYLDVGETIELTKNTTDCAELNRNINDLKNNLISNKRNRIVDFPSIMNGGNRRISSNVKCGIMTGFLVIACIVGSFAFNYGYSFVNQNEDYIVKQQSSGFTGRILQEIYHEELVRSGNYSSKSIILIFFYSQKKLPNRNYQFRIFINI